jgi:hypothetical protein
MLPDVSIRIAAAIPSRYVAAGSGFRTSPIGFPTGTGATSLVLEGEVADGEVAGPLHCAEDVIAMISNSNAPKLSGLLLPEALTSVPAGKR